MTELTLEARIDNIARIAAFVSAQLEPLGCSTRMQRMLDIAIDELISNIAYYSYAPDVGLVTVRVEVQPDAQAVSVSFMDAGRPFNPLLHRDPPLQMAVKDRKSGGFGISIVKKSMDDVRYEYVDGYNVTTITKKIQ